MSSTTPVWMEGDPGEVLARVEVQHPGTSYLELVGNDRFQLVYAAHVVERVPDLVTLLNMFLAPAG